MRAVLTLPYSSGPVEGNINRLKVIKRQMYGRANPDLLRKRVLLTTDHTTGDRTRKDMRPRSSKIARVCADAITPLILGLASWASRVSLRPLKSEIAGQYHCQRRHGHPHSVLAHGLVSRPAPFSRFSSAAPSARRRS